MFCMNCGSQVPDTTKFCPKCGQAIGTAPQANPAASSPTPVIQAASVTKAVGSAVGGVADRLNEMAGGTGHVKLKFGDFFTEAFKKHTSEEADELFACGSKSTTPKITEVSSEWPKPWVWSRVLLIMAITFLGLTLIWNSWHNPITIPGIIVVGSFMVPVATMFFFFETNAPRNISGIKMLEMFLIGGVISLIVVHIANRLLPGSGVGDIGPAMLTGLIEEVAKIAAIVFFMTRIKGRHYILNGLLIGAAVGAGFAAFESAGYAYRGSIVNMLGGLGTLLGSQDGTKLLINVLANPAAYGTDVVALGYPAIMNSVVLRGMLAIGGHVAWAAVEGAALAACEQNSKFDFSQLSNSTFLIFTAIAVVLHGIWDANIPVLDDFSLFMGITPKLILLIIVIWIVVAVMLNRGLQQVNQLASEAENTGKKNVATIPARVDAAVADAAATQAKPGLATQEDVSASPKN